MNRLIYRCCAVALLFVSATILAGPAGDSAQAHFKAIDGGQVDALMAQYHDQATLHWVGGPLDGTYTGKEQLREVWSKFTGTQGTLVVKVSELRESANPKGITVTANVIFSGQNKI